MTDASVLLYLGLDQWPRRPPIDDVDIIYCSSDLATATYMYTSYGSL